MRPSIPLLSVSLGVLVVGAALAVGSLAAAPASAQAAGNASATTVTVSATGEATGEPTTAVIRVESTAVADSPAEATERLAANTTRLRSALDNASVPADRIRTTGFTLEPVRRDGPDPRPPGQSGPPTNASYRASQTFAIDVEDTDRVGELVDVAVANGATSVGGVQFQLSEENRSALREEATRRAMADARAQAETLAGAEELSITGVEEISASEPFAGPEAAVAFDRAEETRIDAGPITVRVSVAVTYRAD